MLSLTYVSSATDLLSESQLVTLLETIRPKNERLGLTGLLLYRDGNIIQTLEGPDDVLEQTFAQITEDPRHKGVFVLLREEITERLFGDWSMGFHNVDAVDQLEGYSAFLKDPVAAELGDSAEPAYRMLVLFRENMR